MVKLTDSGAYFLSSNPSSATCTCNFFPSQALEHARHMLYCWATVPALPLAFWLWEGYLTSLSLSSLTSLLWHSQEFIWVIVRNYHLQKSYYFIVMLHIHYTLLSSILSRLSFLLNKATLFPNWDCVISLLKMVDGSPLISGGHLNSVQWLKTRSWSGLSLIFHLLHSQLVLCIPSILNYFNFLSVSYCL